MLCIKTVWRQHIRSGVDGMMWHVVPIRARRLYHGIQRIYHCRLAQVKGSSFEHPTSDKFTQRELTITHRIVNLRIHVERTIGRIKNLKLLSNIPNNMACVAYQIFFVCANFHVPLCNSDKKIAMRNNMTLKSWGENKLGYKISGSIKKK